MAPANIVLHVYVCGYVVSFPDGLGMRMGLSHIHFDNNSLLVKKPLPTSHMNILSIGPNMWPHMLHHATLLCP